MGDIVPFQVPAALAEKYAELFGKPTGDLSAGVQDSFGVVSFKGKVWRVKFRGEERMVKNADGDPAASLVAVIVKGSPMLSKIYYPGAYTEGDQDAPDCFSVDGVRPDPGAAKPQSPTCAVCPHNVWGSKVTEQGNKTKACSDNRRLAIVPYPDLRNESFGGPLLLRIPPASLQELKTYEQGLMELGLPYQAVITKISFDHQLAYPKLTFTAIKGLDEAEARVVLELMNGTVVDRMLAEAPVVDEAAARAPAASGPAPAASGPAPAQGNAPAPAAQATPQPSTANAATAAPVASETPISAGPVVAEEPKPSVKEQNSAEATNVDSALNSLIGQLL